MPLIFSKDISFVASVILLISQHIVMDNRCVDTSGEFFNGKLLPVSPVMILYETSLHMCFQECDLYMFCLSVNFNRKLRKCELNCRKTNRKLRLVYDKEFVYREIPGVVSIIIYLYIIKKPHSHLTK
jgi:hypothetical protein